MYKCPKCSSVLLIVYVTVQAMLHQEEDNIETTTDDNDHEWDRHSTMSCCECGETAEAGFFWKDKTQ